ncbi:restriction endonuclease subunit S [Microbispora sp. NPDC046933]|uniref:restriction endonuclease subunit S n=1 Tax=Microbispora sp. NPDC046933 TaxID=3155618 RepID=UPI0033E22E0A
MKTAEWPEVKLGDICEFKYGKSLPAAERAPGPAPVYGSNGPVGTHDRYLTYGPTIVVGRKGSFGEISYAAGGCWPIDTTYYIDSSATSVDLRWLYYRLGGLGFKELNRAAAIPGLNRDDAYSKRLLLPPPEEQRRIAQVLDQANELRANRRQAITLLDDLAQSIFLEMFGPDSHYSLLPLGAVLNFVTSGGRGWAKYYAPSGSRFIRSLDVRMNHISSRDAVYVKAPDNAEARRTRVAAGDVLLTITGSLIGRVSAAGQEHDGSYISQHVAILRPNPGELDPHFLAFYLSLPSGGQRQIRKMQYGQTKPGLNFDQIRAFEIPKVPIKEQRKFVAVLREVQGQVLQMQGQLLRLDECYASLEAHAFHGRL